MNDLVDQLNSYGYNTILSTHLNENSKADYTVIEKHNDVVNESMAKELGVGHPKFFYSDEDIDIETPFDYNHGLAVLSLLRNAVDFADVRGHKVIHVVNYDYYIKDKKILLEHSKELESHDYVCYSWRAEDEVNTSIFSCRTEKIKSALDKVKTHQDYFRLGVHFEQFMFNLLRENDLKIKNLGKIDERYVVVNAETLPAYPLFDLGKDVFHYAISKEENTGRIILSILGYTSYQIEIRIEHLNRIKKLFVSWDILHFEITEENLRKGIKMYLPSFELSVTIDEKTKISCSKVKNWSKVEKFDLLNLEEDLSKIPKINVHYIEGPFVEILGSKEGKYSVDFIDEHDSKVVHHTEIGQNCWSQASRKWYTDWRILVKDLHSNTTIYDKKIDLRDQRVFVCFESSSLGDTIAWIPYVEEFRKKHGCKVLVSTFYNYLFSTVYPELEFLERGVDAKNIIASYRIGWFYENEKEESNLLCNPKDVRNQPMQKTASDILGLDYTQIRPRIALPNTPRTISEKYVCIGIHSTTQAKYWNRENGWQEVVDYLKSNGYQVVLITKETGTYMGNTPPSGIIDKTGSQYSLIDRINDLQHAEFYIGLGSGLSWLAWAVGTPTVLISGFSTPETEFHGDDVARVFNGSACNGCFNRRRLDAGDWNWCPDHKGSSRQFECTRTITSQSVIESMKKFLS